MSPRIGRLLLLLLLACDWAVDPYQGTSPLSRPLASTESFCHSLVHREHARQASALELQHFFQTPIDRSATPPLQDSSEVGLAALLAPPGYRLYVLMSLQC
jgi:hypothetical protein